MSGAEGKGERTMILFEGNIAAGKSTVGRRLHESGLFGFIEEPVDTWQKEFASNLLEMFYKDPERWAFTFQLAAFTTRAKTWTEVLAKIDHSTVILERSIYCDRYVFAKNCYQSGLMSETEWQIYCRMWDWLQRNWCTNPDKIIYLRASSELCHRRINDRKRSEEKAIPIEYLRDLEVLHDEWLADNPLVTRIDITGEEDEEETAQQVITVLRKEGFG